MPRNWSPRPMKLEDANYQHPGWVGAPYFSDFHARWGLIRLDEILDCSHIAMTREAAREAQRQGYQYFISQCPSRYGSRLYMVTGQDGRFVCIYGRLVQQKYNAEQCKAKYTNDLDSRVRHILMVARYRARLKGLPFDLDADDIIRRVRAGQCEVTGLPFRLDVVGNDRNPFMPSIDRIDSRLGYTADNVQVVCLGLNLMKTNFDGDLLDQFLDGWLQNRRSAAMA